jgi:replicative DNA helicase
MGEHRTIVEFQELVGLFLQRHHHHWLSPLGLILEVIEYHACQAVQISDLTLSQVVLSHWYIGLGHNRVQEISEITTGLKALAKELAIPVMALSQLSRAPENRTEKHPQLADLRDSGSIEQDADIVMFVFREEYYLERLKPESRAPNDAKELADWMSRMAAAKGKAEVIIAKRRGGPIGTVPLQFDSTLTRFSDLCAPTRFERSGP